MLHLYNGVLCSYRKISLYHVLLNIRSDNMSYKTTYIISSHFGQKYIQILKVVSREGFCLGVFCLSVNLWFLLFLQ